MLLCSVEQARVSSDSSNAEAFQKRQSPNSKLQYSKANSVRISTRIEEHLQSPKKPQSNTRKHYKPGRKPKEHSCSPLLELVHPKPEIQPTQKCIARKNAPCPNNGQKSNKGEEKNDVVRDGCPEFRLLGSDTSIQGWKKVQDEMHRKKEEEEKKENERRLVDDQEEAMLFQKHEAKDTFHMLMSVMSDETHALLHGDSTVSLTSDSAFSEDDFAARKPKPKKKKEKGKGTRNKKHAVPVLPVPAAIEPLPVVVSQASKIKTAINEPPRKKCINDRDRAVKHVVEEPAVKGPNVSVRPTMSFMAVKDNKSHQLHEEDPNEQKEIEDEPVVPDQQPPRRPSEDSFASPTGSAESWPAKYEKALRIFSPDMSDIYAKTDVSHISIHGVTYATSLHSCPSDQSNDKDKKRMAQIQKVLKREKRKVKHWIQQERDRRAKEGAEALANLLDPANDPCTLRGNIV